MDAYSKYISEDADMQTMLFRYSVITDVFNTRLPKEVTVRQRLSDELKKKIMLCPYSEQNARLLFLYGVGVLDESTIKKLVLQNNSDFLSDVIALEDTVRRGEGENEDDVLSYGKLQSILLLCANSKKYAELSPLDFSGAIEAASSNHVFLTENGFIRCDSDLTAFLNELGMPFGFYDEYEDTFNIEESRYIPEALDNSDISSEKWPLAADMRRLKQYLEVYDEPYGREFIRYSAANRFDDFEKEYKKFLEEMLNFSIKAYVRRRNICGDEVNYYDYAVNSFENGMLVNSELDEMKTYSDSFTLGAVTEFTDEAELVKKALKKYTSNHQLLDDMVVEITHCGKSAIYIYRDNKLSETDSRKFRSQLFDFNKIWGIIQKCSREKKIRRNGDTITIPQEYMDEIAPEQRVYAVNMIKDQYSRMLEKTRHNKDLRTFNEIREAAGERMKKGHNADSNDSHSGGSGVSNRRPSISGYTANNENGGN